MTAFATRLRELSDRFEALSLRERAMIAAAALVSLGMLWLVAVDDRLASAVVKERALLKAARNAADAEVTAQQQLRTLHGTTSVASLTTDRARLQSALDTLGEELDQIVRAFVNPKQMPKVLRILLAEQSGVKLMRIESIDPVALTAPSGEVTGLFQHGFRIRLNGAYFDIVRFLDALEQSPWRLSWRELDYSVAGYPLAQVDLQVETLSRERSLIGI